MKGFILLALGMSLTINSYCQSQYWTKKESDSMQFFKDEIELHSLKLKEINKFKVGRKKEEKELEIAQETSAIENLKSSQAALEGRINRRLVKEHKIEEPKVQF
jgi:hypothetical protein